MSDHLKCTGRHPIESAPDLLATARAVELAALIKSGNAHWRPATFHYEAPSGEHRSDFIRVGDAIRSPRDATVIATWLYPYVATGRAIIVDSSTMLPIVLALQAAVAPLGVKIGPVAVRDAYPHSLLLDEELVELTVGANGALALLSVSSTGHTARFVRAVPAGAHRIRQERCRMEAGDSRSPDPATGVSLAGRC